MANSRAYVGYVPASPAPIRIHVEDESGTVTAHLTVEQAEDVRDDLALLVNTVKGTS